MTLSTKFIRYLMSALGRKWTLYLNTSPLHRALHHAEKRKINLGKGELLSEQSELVRR